MAQNRKMCRTSWTIVFHPKKKVGERYQLDGVDGVPLTAEASQVKRGTLVALMNARNEHESGLVRREWSEGDNDWSGETIDRDSSGGSREIVFSMINGKRAAFESIDVTVNQRKTPSCG